MKKGEYMDSDLIEVSRNEYEYLKAYNQVYLNEIERYKAEIKELEAEIQKLKIEIYTRDIEEKRRIENSHNSRGAGRKARFTDEEKETMKMYRLQGLTIKEIATMYECSVGLVHKLINEK